MSSSLTPTTRLNPPFIQPLTDDGGQHSQAWQDHHQAIADQLADMPAKLRKGVTDGSDAAAGDIGEYLTATSGAVPLTTGALANVVSLSLTAGDWDVQGNVTFTAGTGTHNYFMAGVTSLDTYSSATYPSVAIYEAITTATRRVNVTATTTVWVVAQAAFAGTCSATGAIRARRMR